MPDIPAYDYGDIPDDDTLMSWVIDGVAECPDGCETETDGKCIHGQDSWLVILGMI